MKTSTFLYFFKTNSISAVVETKAVSSEDDDENNQKRQRASNGEGLYFQVLFLFDHNLANHSFFFFFFAFGNTCGCGIL